MLSQPPTSFLVKRHLSLTHFLVFACILSVALVPAHSQEAEVQTEEAPERVSAFSAGGIERNPFWPIGWAPGQTPAEPTKPKILVTQEQFTITSILLGPPNYAVINGRDYGEEDLVPLSTAQGEITVRIRAIRDGFVLVDYEGEAINIPFRR
ncbi:MAG: hypothetical protein ACFCU3_09310 [Verrucomicrobiales bacterium]